MMTTSRHRPRPKNPSSTVVIRSRFDVIWRHRVIISHDTHPVRRPTVGPAFTSSAYFSRLTGFALPWAHQGSGFNPQPVCVYTALPFFPFPAMPEVSGVTVG
ncbi:hypothetical protein Q3G72_019411 [Acer saccharum]|nr:hypothetical protein Q3G72_019411 [Acer saccharum]